MADLVLTIFFISIVCGACLAFYGYTLRREKPSRSCKICCYVCSVLILIAYVVVLFSQIHSYNTTHMEYTVAADDTVSLNEFHQKYEIISENGAEYRVKEKS